MRHASTQSLRVPIRTLLPAVVLAVSAPVWPQVPESAGETIAPTAESDPPEEAIEEITVVAPRTVRSIRSDIIRVEEVLYDLFNSLNTNPDFRVSCGWENRNTGNPTTTSRIKEWRCQTAYERDILAQELGGASGEEAIQRAMQLGPSMAGPVRRHREAFEQHLIEVAEKNPELARAIYIRAALEQDLAAARARKVEKE